VKMQALTLFNQNFAVGESLLQLYQIFHGLTKCELREDLRLAVLSQWGAPENSVVQGVNNDRVTILARAAARIPESLTVEGGLDFLLRQVVVVACTSVEAFFWDSLRENVLTIVRARRSGADDSLKNLQFTLGDYISLQQYDDPDVRVRQIILKNFERGTLYSAESIEKIARILTISKFWEQVEKKCGEPSANLKRQIGELITRRNQIAHRADRPDDGEDADGHGLRPISIAWVNLRVQGARTLVAAAADLIGETIKRLESDLQAAREQEEARKLAGGNR
jgi:hypothetical protein